MQKIKNSQWFIVALMLAMFASFSMVSAQGQEQSNQNQQQNQINGEQHRNTVSTFVKNLLDVAGKEKSDIGLEVKAVATEQDESKEKIAEAIDKVKNRNILKTFLIGSDYKNIGELRSEMVKTGNRIDRLSTLLDKTTTDDNKAAIQTQLQTLTQEQQKIENFVNTNESKFSLFGWFVKIFSR